MGIFDFWTGSHSNPEVRTSLTRKQLETLIGETSIQMYYKEYAIQLCINKLVSALSLCRFETFKEKEKKQDHYWWKFNYEPNINTNMHDFLYQIVYQMVYNEDGALVIQSDSGDLLVAKSFNIVEGSHVPNIYTNVEVYGGHQFQRSFIETDVLRFQLPNKRVKSLIDSLYQDYGKFISMTMDSFIRDRSLKLILNISSMFSQEIEVTTDEDGNEIEFDPIEDLMTKRFKNLFSNGNTITPLEEGLTLSYLEGNPRTNKTTLGEVNEQIDKMIDLAADAFGIPRGLLKGDVADVEAMTNNFITFAVRPIARELETEINRKLYRKDNVMVGTRLKVITGSIQTYNIISFANAADKLIASSTATPNEMREAIEWEPSKQKGMDEFKETKNYQKLGDSDNKEN